MLRIEEGSRALMRVECRQASAAALVHLTTPNKKGRDAVRIAAFRPSWHFVTRCQRSVLNNDICCICENRVCAACRAVLSSWYWLMASA